MRALVLSGGGSKGAYQTGALKYLLGELQIAYDVFCGVSVGAINSAFLAMYPTGQEIEASTRLAEMWSVLDNSKIYKRHFPFGRWHAIWKKSFFDSSPMHILLRANIDLDRIRLNNKHVCVGCVSLSSGKYTIFDQTSDHFVDAVIASASFPGMLSPVSFMGQLWADGGIKEISPIKKAVELGADIIDIIVTSPQTRIKHFIENPTTSDILKRVIDLSADKILANDIEKVEMYNKLASVGLTDKKFVQLNIIRPDFNLIEDLLDFRPHKLAEMTQKGYEDTKRKLIM
jgi:NTE family protein